MDTRDPLERAMDRAAAAARVNETIAKLHEIDRLRAEVERLRERLGPLGLEVVEIGETGHYVNEKVKAEIERLRAENEQLRKWKALDKPLTAAMEIANGDLMQLRADNERLRAALKRLIADYEDVPDPTDADGQAVFANARDALADQGKG